jgi:hypothetical protein
LARIGDYLGASFGPFTIYKHIGSGKDAEAFACRDGRNGLSYVLRLDAADRDIWAGPPRLPPRNASIERANATGTWAIAGSQWKQAVKDRKRDPDSMVIAAVDVYGVVDLNYLVLVAPPVRTKHAPDVDEIVRRIPTDLVTRSLLWRELCQALGAHLEPPVTIPEGALDGALDRLWSKQFAESALPWLWTANIAPEWRERIGRLDPGGTEVTPLPEENLLFRLVCGLGKGSLTAEELAACFRCRHFRANVSAGEAHQLLAANNLISTIMGFSTSSVLGWMISLLESEPADEIADASEFELRKQQRDLDEFELFLQSPAGQNQLPVTLAMNDEGYHLKSGAVNF